MKPAPFDYRAPRSVDEALELLSHDAEDTKVLAGGMSLGPLLNLRLSAPSVLMDLNGVSQLAYGRIDEGTLRIGAMWRQRSLERSANVAAGWPLLTDAIHWVAHPTVRNRGTVGGSLSHADPSAELPTVALALDATLVVGNARRQRTITASDFFVTFLATAMEKDELLLEVQFPPTGLAGSTWTEHATRRGDFAQVGIACVVLAATDGTVASTSIALGGISDTPVKVPEDLVGELVGSSLDDAATAEFAAAVAAAFEPSPDLLAGTEYKRRLIRHLLPTALRSAHDKSRHAHGHH